MASAGKSRRFRTFVMTLLGGVATLPAISALAQVTPSTEDKPAAKAGRATILGLVVDSLHGGYLVGAEVMVEGQANTVVTDSTGRFEVGGLMPGTYRVGIFHPVLDTLGIALATRRFHVGPDSASITVLGVPSATTLVAQWCPSRANAEGNSAVVGQVVDPESRRPVAGADVSLSWADFTSDKKKKIQMTPRVLRATTDTLGKFRLCGLPSALEANLEAKRGSLRTSEVTIALGEAPTALVVRTLLLSTDTSGATSGNAVVSGRVALEGNSPRAGSLVTLVGTNAASNTDEQGEFTLRNLPSGTHVLLVRHLGYAPTAVSVDLSSWEPKKISVTLEKSMNIMEPVLVVARRTAALERVGFVGRRNRGLGKYFGPEDLDQIRPNRFSDILRLVPSLDIRHGPYGETIVTSMRMRISSVLGGGCRAQFYVDGMRWFRTGMDDINAFVPGKEVVGVEVYNPPFIPSEFISGMDRCPVVVIWTKWRVRA
jgi:hypothetical protein